MSVSPQSPKVEDRRRRAQQVFVVGLVLLLVGVSLEMYVLTSPNNWGANLDTPAGASYSFRSLNAEPLLGVPPIALEWSSDPYGRLMTIHVYECTETACLNHLPTPILTVVNGTTPAPYPGWVDFGAASGASYVAIANQTGWLEMHQFGGNTPQGALILVIGVALLVVCFPLVAWGALRSREGR